MASFIQHVYAWFLIRFGLVTPVGVSIEISPE